MVGRCLLSAQGCQKRGQPICCPAPQRVGCFRPWPAPRGHSLHWHPAVSLSCPLQRTWACLSWSCSSPCSGQVLGVPIPQHPSQSLGWPSTRMNCSEIPHPHRSAGPRCCPQQTEDTHALLHAWGHTQHGATYLPRPAYANPASLSKCHLTLEATHSQKQLVGGEYKASPGGLQSVRTTLPFSPDAARGHSSLITMSAIALCWLPFSPWHLGPPQHLPCP